MPGAQTNQFLNAQTGSNLPPARPALFDEFAARSTGELVQPPASVTEGTTRHLQMDDDGDSIYKPRQPLQK